MIYDTNGVPVNIKESIVSAVNGIPLPARWNGFDLIWKKEPKIEIVYIGAVVKGCLNGYLFGLKHDLSLVLADGMDISPGFFVEYRLASEVAGEVKAWSLLQRESIFFSNLDCKFNSMEASELPQPQKEALFDVSASMLENIFWPISNGELMELILRLKLPNSKFCTEKFVWDKEIFLFVDSKEGWECVCLLGVDEGQQSVTMHYEQEQWSRN